MINEIVLLVIVVSFVITVLSKPRFAVLLLVFFAVFDFGFFTRWIGVTRYFARVPYLLAIFILIKILLDFSIRQINIKKEEKLLIVCLKFFLCLFILVVFSNVYNNENLVLGFYELRYYLFLIILIFAFYFYIPSRYITTRVFLIFCSFIGLLQIPITTIQYILVEYFKIYLSKSALDMSSGSFSSYAGLLFMQCVAIASILEYQFKVQKPLIRINNYLLAFLFVIPLFLSYSRSAMGFVLVTIFIVFGKNTLVTIDPVTIIKRVIPLIAIILIITVAFIQFFWKPHFNISDQLNPNYINEYFFREAKDIEAYKAGAHPVMGRGRAVTESIQIVSEGIIHSLVGMGSGSGSEASLINSSGKYFHAYGPLAGIGRTQISKIILELGFIGFFINIVLFVRLYKNVSTYSYDMLSKNLLFNVIMIIFFTSFYATIFSFEVSLLIFAFLAVLNQKH